jgi:hypothetical protein
MALPRTSGSDDTFTLATPFTVIGIIVPPPAWARTSNPTCMLCRLSLETFSMMGQTSVRPPISVR